MDSKTLGSIRRAGCHATLVAALALSASAAHAANEDAALSGIDAAGAGANARPSDTGKLSNNLASVFDEQEESRADLASMAASRGMQTAGDAIVLDVVLDRYASNLTTLLRRAGGRVRHVSEEYLRASVAVPGREAAERIAEIPAVQHVYPSYGYMTNVGSVTSRAVDALDVTPIAGAPDNLDGTGQKVGILSDSFNRTSDVHDGDTTPEACNSGSLSGSNPQESGDLPSSVEIRADDADGGSSADACPDDSTVNPGTLIDEGAAMAELVHDIAPDADLAFHTVGGSIGRFATGIDDLCTASGSGGAGATVAVDDIIFFAELMYQPDAVSQAVSNCEANGVPYFTSAGNFASQAFRFDYTDFDPNDNDDDATDGDGDGAPTALNGDFHDWNPSGSSDSALGITLNNGEGFTAILQWNQPALSVPQNSSNGPQIDLDLLLLDSNSNIVTSSREIQDSSDASAGADPVEIITYTNNSGGDKTLFLAVDHWTGSRSNIPQDSNTPLEFRLVFSETGSPSYQYTPSDSPMFGHQQAAAGSSVGAVPWWEAPSFDPGNQGPTSNIDPEPFTSKGGTLKRFFNPDGTFNESSTDQPAFAAVDANNNTFFGRAEPNGTPSVDGEDDSFPNFFGTSAAAPNAAAVTALLQDYADGVAPKDIHEVLASTAIDVTGKRASTRDDDTTGAGLIDADAALAKFPTADAGSDKTVEAGINDVALDGSASSDDASLSAFTWTQISGPTNVSITNADQQTASFDAPLSTTGTYEFKLSVEDSDGLTHADRVQVTVNGLPSASDDSASVDEDNSVNVDVLANDDFGADGPSSSSITVSGSPSNGTATVKTNGTSNDPTDDTIDYTPESDYTGPDSFDYTIADSDGEKATATVSVDVTTASDDDSGGSGGGGGGALGWLLLSGLLCGVVGLRRRGYGFA